MATPTPPLLSLTDVTVSYGAVQALKGVTLAVQPREIVALLGGNGAGKTTTLRAISRTVPATGELRFAGQDLRQVPPHAVVARGLAHVPEGRRIFADLTVLENLDLGAYCEPDARVVKQRLDEVLQLFPRLAERRQQKGGTLSGGEQQMLAVGRALMGRPQMLLLDEPSLGLAPQIVERIFELIVQINRDTGVAILLVEQNANEALLHAHRAYILETGRVLMSGPAADLRHDPRVQAAYLGG